MEQWLAELLKQSPSFALLAIVLVIVFKQQQAREERAYQERKEMMTAFETANARLVDQLGAQILKLDERMNAEHQAMMRADEYQRREHETLLRVVKGGKE